MKTHPLIRIVEQGFTDVDIREGRTVTYMDHQPGDGTRYEITAIDVGGRLRLGQLGYVSQDAVLVISGMGGRAYLFSRGDDVSEFYVEEKFALTNPHTVHHITELIARAIDGRVVACDHGAPAEAVSDHAMDPRD